jgi:small subunit ribosomal protein S3
LGHKVHPIGFRLGVIKGWESRWYADRNYKELLTEDRKLRDLIRKQLHNAGISRIEIERVAGTQISITIHTAKPGIVIGKSGESVERLRQQLERMTKKKVRLSILEIRNPELEAPLVACGTAEQPEKRISFRRAMKQAVQKSMRQGAKGIKVVMGGRLGGAEIARTEKEVDGSVPLQTLRADIDYGLAEAHTTYGRIGIKVWIYRGDILPARQGGERLTATAAALPTPGERGGRPERGRGERGGRSERGGDRRTAGAGTGGRTTRSSGPGTRSAGGSGSGTGSTTRTPRARGAATSYAASKPAGVAPEGTVEGGQGADLPSNSSQAPAPTAHEPSTAANRAEAPTETPSRERESESES